MFRLCGMFTLILAASAAMFAQGTASFKGTARDSTGYAIPGVSVKLRNVATGAEAQTVSGPEGAYAFAGLAPGTYSLTASAAGFQKKVLVGVVIGDGPATDLDLTLKVAGVTESVEISGALPFLCPTQSDPAFQPSLAPMWELPTWSHFPAYRVLAPDASGNGPLIQAPTREKKAQDAEPAPSKDPK